MAASLRITDCALDWLLEDGDPSVRCRTFTELLGRRPSDADVRPARRRVPDSPARRPSSLRWRPMARFNRG
jgi:hypothetical protein